MKNLIIIGAGGMGRSVYCIALGCIGYNEFFKIKGFIDDNLSSLDEFENYPPILGTISEYVISDDDVFICSVGDVNLKKKICLDLEARGATFISLIHKTAILRLNSKIDVGCIVADYVSIGADAIIGKHSLIQSYSVVAHDCVLGDFVRIDTHSVCVGGVKIENLCMIHTGAILSHNVTIGEGAHVAAGSFVIKKVKPWTTVYGNPAKYLK